MRVLIILAIILFTLLVCLSNSQTYSDITYDAGTQVDIGTGADVCATNVYINGTFTGGGTICGGPLPVELGSFTYTVLARTVVLQWVTMWEMNNSGFDVERSTAGGNGGPHWQKIGFVPGSGTTNEEKAYYYKDENLSKGVYKYRLKQIDYNGHYEYFDLGSDIEINPPIVFSMSQNYPNPSNPKSKINFEIPVTGRVTIKIYDVTGKEVMILLDEMRDADYYTIEFDGSNLASGVYFYNIIFSGDGQKFTKTMKMVLVK